MRKDSGVSEVDPNGKAALEIRENNKYISKIVGLPTTRIVDHEESRSARKRPA